LISYLRNKTADTNSKKNWTVYTTEYI